MRLSLAKARSSGLAKRISRRQLICRALALAVASTMLGAKALRADQSSPRSVRIGLISIGSSKELAPKVTVFLEQLKTLGYVGGRDLRLETRWADGDLGRLPDLAADLVRGKVDILVATTTYDVRAARNATSTIPIVMVTAADPVATGLVANLAHPGGNVTGLSLMTIELSIKRLQILKDAVPRAARVAVLWNPNHPFHAKVVEGIKAAAPSLAIQPIFVSAQTPDQLPLALAAAKRGRAQALSVIEDPFFYLHRAAISQLAAKEGLPAIYGAKEYAVSGGLISYGPNYDDLWRRAASYVDRILKGAKPSDLPIEQPTTFDLVINLKTAERLGLKIPASMLVQATEVIR